MNEQRIVAVDAARGIALVLVCLSHIKQHLVVSAPDLQWVLMTVTRIATPTFLLLSGFVISHLLRNDRRGTVPVMLVDRGLFLILIAHVLLSLKELPPPDPLLWLFGRVEITDAVGVALLVAILVRRWSTQRLAAVGGTIGIVSWFIAINVHPESDFAGVMGAVSFGIRDARMPLTVIPIVPYVGVFMIGMALNIHLMSKQSIDESDISRRLTAMAVVAMLSVVAGIVAWHFGKGVVAAFVNDPVTVDAWRATLSPTRKYPPSPAYLLFYGGAGLLILASFFRGQPRWLIERIKAPASVLGRASLMCFVVQDWLLWAIPHHLGFAHITAVGFWLGYFVAVVLVLYGLSRLWGSHGGNRLLTVGLKALSRRRRAAVELAAGAAVLTRLKT
jgi:uncharacterized membrane protein